MKKTHDLQRGKAGFLKTTFLETQLKKLWTFSQEKRCNSIRIAAFKYLRSGPMVEELNFCHVSQL
jgi:hypothetical protein